MLREYILLGGVELHEAPTLRGKLHQTVEILVISRAEEIRITEQWKEPTYNH